MKIYPIKLFTTYNNISLAEEKTGLKKQDAVRMQGVPSAHYNDYLLSFEARVDKGLERFYNTNKDYMPSTVREYVENLEDKSNLTPLQAQKNAYELLEISQTIDDIKSAYPNEPLFENLKNPAETRATKGILMSVKENDELLKLSGQGVLKDKSNLTVYLVKKIFLEDKTIDEINKDLDKDLDDDFKADFKFKNKNSKYIYPSTLNSLGIQAPKFEYRQSLRYTREGYSDMVGSKISEGQRAFWEALSKEDRTARAKKSAEKFENWWKSLTKDEIFDMIAEQATVLDMLKKFKKQQTKESKKSPKAAAESKTAVERGHVKVGSSALSQDELFVIWASNNLKIYMENLSEAEKDTIHIKRMRNLAARWAEMTPEARTDYISKMKSGSEPLRYTMIDAWNHSTALLKDLSLHLKQNQIYKPADLLYSTDEFSQFQSKVMTEFWENHPKHAKILGEHIKMSQERVQNAISNGTFEELKKQIMRDKNQRVKELNSLKSSNLKTDIQKSPVFPDYMIDFKNSYYKTLGGQLKNLPQEYINDYFRAIYEGFSKDHIIAWTKNLKGLPCSPEERDLLRQISETEPPEWAYINRAIEAALADTVYECTKNPEVYKLSHSDLKVALYQIDRGQEIVSIGSKKLDQFFEFNIVKRRIDKNRIAALYHLYKEPLTEDELDNVLDGYFRFYSTESKEKFEKMLKTYGKSLNIVFSDKSAYPNAVKNYMLYKILSDKPADVEDDIICTLFSSYDSNVDNDLFAKEDKIKHVKYLLSKRFSFIPNIYLENYLSETGKALRERSNDADFQAYEMACQKRTSARETHKLAVVPKSHFSTKNAIRTLAMEQALSDILYNATGNTDVYKLQFEELCDCIEIFNLSKKYPSDKRTFQALNGDIVELTAQRRPNLSGLSKAYLEYLNDVIDWVNTDVKAGNGTLEDLICILNPDETKPDIDNAVEERIKPYRLNLK